MNPVKCPNCGKINDGSTDFCIYCGTIYSEYKADEDSYLNVLPFRPTNGQKNKESTFSPFDSIKDPDNKEVKIDRISSSDLANRRFYRILIIIGYITAIFGFVFGVIISVFLITRKDPYVKQHGWIQLSILICWILLVAALILSGQLDVNLLLNQMNMSQLNNLTSNSSSTNITNIWGL